MRPGWGYTRDPSSSVALTHAPHQPYTAVGDTMHQANQLLRSGAARADSHECRDPQAGARGDPWVTPTGRWPPTAQGASPRLSLAEPHAAPGGGRWPGVAAIGVVLWGESGSSPSCTNVSRMRPKDRGKWWVLVGSLGWGSRGCSQNSIAVWRAKPCPIAKGTAFPIALPPPIFPVCSRAPSERGDHGSRRAGRHDDQNPALSGGGAAQAPQTTHPLLLQLLDVPRENASLMRFSPQELKVRTFALLRHLVLPRESAASADPRRREPPLGGCHLRRMADDPR